MPGRTSERGDWQMLGLVLPGAVFLLCIGLLVGAAWTTQALQARFRRLAEERRRLDQEWAAIHAALHHGERCPHCHYRLTERDRHPEQLPVEDPTEDD